MVAVLTQRPFFSISNLNRAYPAPALVFRPRATLLSPWRTLRAVELIPEFPGTLEGDYFPGSEHHVVTGRWIAPAPFFLLVNTELTETTDQDILASGQGVFNNCQN